MKSLAISAKKREKVGKADSKALRNQGNVPCVLYGGEQQVCFYAHENDFRNLVYTPDVFIVDLDIDGEKRRAIMKDIQFHPVTDKLLHIDFLEVFNDKEVTVSVPVILKGLAIGVRNGGNLMFRRRKIITRAIPENLPDAITIDIENIKIGEFIYIKDVRDDAYKFLAPDNAVIVGVKTARTAIEDEIDEEESEEEGVEGEGAEDGGKTAEDSSKKEGDQSKDQKPAEEKEGEDSSPKK